jgi:hypothetical protein
MMRKWLPKFEKEKQKIKCHDPSAVRFSNKTQVFHDKKAKDIQLIITLLASDVGNTVP